MPQPLTTGVILCTRNRPIQLLACLESLATQTSPISQIIIIDSSIPKLEDNAHFFSVFNSGKFSNSELIYQHTSPSLTYQRNLGITKAKADVIFFFDDDVIIYPNYIEIILSNFLRDPDVGGGMGRIVNLPSSENTLGQYIRRFFLLQHTGDDGRLLKSGFPVHPHRRLEYQEVEILSGALAAYRMDVLRRHKFDEYFAGYAYMEDVEYSYRVSRDYPLFYDPRAMLEHHHPSTDKRDRANIKKMYLINHHYIFFKHIFPHCRTCLFNYVWSIIGLFVFAGLNRQWSAIKGYFQGLREVIELRRGSKDELPSG